jgi:NAD(P)-dependent dehydrogenase (short-subunit alcohol dehydrogenase family)
VRNLSGKVAVVTGAGSGIGRATAAALAARGAVVAAADQHRGTAEETAAAIIASGGRASAHQVDVASEPAMRTLVDDVLSTHGVVDVVVNNAGIAPPPTRVAEIDLAGFHRVVDVNFWGMVHGSLLFLPHLRARPEANLVNVASNAALVGYSLMAPYSASKFAIRGFTEALRMELRRSPVAVTLVCPGATRTAIMAHSPLAAEGRRQGLQRRWDRVFVRPPERVARAIVTAIERDRPRCLTGADTVALDAVSRLLPATHARIVGPPVELVLGRIIDSRSM